MNQKRAEVEKRRILNKLQYNSLSGSQENCFKCYSSETRDHILKKFHAWLKLRKAGFSVWTECIFKDTKARPDILAYKNGKFIIMEILESETMKQLAEKTKKYPNIDIIGIKTLKEIKELEV